MSLIKKNSNLKSAFSVFKIIGLVLFYLLPEILLPAKEKVIIQAEQSVPPAIDNLKTYSYGVGFILFNTLGTLVELDRFGTMVPALAEKYEISNDGLKYHFTLRKDIKFSNGRPITTEDVVYSFKRHLIAKGHYHAVLRERLKGAKDFNKSSQNIDGLHVLNEREIEIILLKTIPKFLMYLSCINLAIVPKEATKIDTTEIEFIHPASGPYKVVAHNKDEVTLSVVKEHYLYKQGMADKVIFKRMEDVEGLKALKNGKINLIHPRSITYDDLLEFKNDNYQLIPALELVNLMIFNHTSAFMKKFPKLPGLLNKYINRDELIDKEFIEFVAPAFQIIPYGFLGHDPKYNKTSVTKEEILKYTKGEKITVTFGYRSNNELTKKLVKVLKEVNIEAVLTEKAMGDTRKFLTDSKWDIAVILHGIDYQFPEEIFESMLPHDNVFHMDLNNKGYKTLPEQDNLITLEDRVAFIKKMNEIFYEDGIVIPYAFTKAYWVATKEIDFGKIPLLFSVFPMSSITLKD